MKKEIMQGTILLVKEDEEDQEHVANITKWTWLTGDRLLRSVEASSQWRKSRPIHEAANPRIEDGYRYKVLLFREDICSVILYVRLLLAHLRTIFRAV